MSRTVLNWRQAALAAAALGIVLPADALIRITLQPQASVPFGPVRLDQVAQVQGAPAETTHRLAAVHVATLHRQAGERVLQGLELQRAVKRLLGPAAPVVQWQGAAAITLRVQRQPSPAGPLAVQRLDAVTLGTNQGDVVVQQPAQALAPGRPGDLVGARLGSGAILRARVMAPGQLSLEGSE